MTTNMKTQVDDQMVLLSQYYPRIYDQLVPKQEEVVKPRRRRNKSKTVRRNNGMRKRMLTDEQVNLLEKNFGKEHKLESERNDRLASELGLDPRQVAVWFQNRRARWKSKKLEEDYMKLKTQHESTVLKKCQLETEVLNLKEQLSEVEKEINRPVSYQWRSVTFYRLPTKMLSGHFERLGVSFHRSNKRRSPGRTKSTLCWCMCCHREKEEVNTGNAEKDESCK